MAPEKLLESVFAELGGTISAADAAQILERLRAELAKLSPEEAVRAVRGFLESRRDAATRMQFQIGDGGNLDSAPTLRVWLLDELGRLQPAAAADYARHILSAHDSADEWAVALRNYARGRAGNEDRQFLQAKARELLNDPRWQQEQSAGWLEAFDVVVHTQASELTPDLAHLVVQQDKATKPAAYAAYLTLDRLTLADPVSVLRQLQDNPELMTGREQTRANYFARADARDSDQRSLLETYLLDSRRTAEELTAFAGTFPNANFAISTNLLTASPTFANAELIARDRAALETVEAWIADDRFSGRKDLLMAMQARIKEFVRQAEASAPEK